MGSSYSGWRIGTSLPTCGPATASTARTARSMVLSVLLTNRKTNRYICPAGQPLNYGGQSHRNHAWTYIGTRKRCGPCALRAQCTSAAFRCLVIHQHEPARQRARELANTPEFAQAQRQRKKVEALFAELKNQIGLRRLRLRRLKFVREQFFLAAVAQNIKRLVRFLSQGPRSILPATT